MAEYELVMVARAVKKGNGFTEAAKDVDQLNKKVKESGQGAENFGKKLNSTLDGAVKGFAAVTGAAVTFKKTFDYSREGAELNQLTDSFELLNKNVLQTPDLLEDMRQAAGGTIKDTDLMAGVLKLAAGTTGEYARTLANISPQLLEIARASNKLNPALGDTAFLYESLTTAAKRQSVPIADNLGLIIKMDDAVKKVHPSLQNLASDYDQLTDQQKFLNELLFQGGNLIDQVGGDVNSQADAWARLSVQVVTITDNWKRMLADGLNPIVAAMAGDYGDAAEETAAKTLAQANSVEELTEKLKRSNDAYELSRTFLGRMTGTQDEATRATVDNALKLAANTDSVEAYQAALAAAGIDMLIVRRLMEEIGEDAVFNGVAFADTAQAIFEYARVANEAAAADAVLLGHVREWNEVVPTATAVNEELNDKLAQQAAHLEGVALANAKNRAEFNSMTEAAVESLTPLQEINAALAEMAAQETANEQAAAYADNLARINENASLTAASADVMEEKLTGVYNGMDRVSTGAETAAGKVGGLRDSINSLEDKVVTVTVNQKINTATFTEHGGVGADQTPGGGGRAAGGAVFPGVRYPVGEGNKPELLSTPDGLFMIPGDQGRVFSNAQSQGMMGNTYNINIDARGATDATAVYQAGYLAARQALLESGARADQIRRTR